MLDKKRILVTGAKGFIGSTLCSYISSLQYQLLKVGRRSNSTNCEIVIDDLSSFNDWSKILVGVDTVIHLAGRAHMLDDISKDKIEKYRCINTFPTIALANEASRVGVRRFIYLSTIGVNGNETFDKPFTATDTPQPHSPYAISKHEAEIALNDLSRSSTLEVVIIRPPLVYGLNAPGNISKVMNMLKKNIPLPLGSIANNKRSFVSVDNLVNLIITCIESPTAANRTFLVSDGKDISTSEFLKYLAHSIGRKHMILPFPEKAISYLLRSMPRQDIAISLLGNLQVDIKYTSETLAWMPASPKDQI